MKSPKRLFQRLRANLRTAIENPEGGWVSLHLSPTDAGEFEKWLIRHLDGGTSGRPPGAKSEVKHDGEQMRQVTRLLGLGWGWKRIAIHVGWTTKSVDALKKAHRSHLEAQRLAADRSGDAVVKSIGRNLKRSLSLRELPLPLPRLLRDKKP